MTFAQRIKIISVVLLVMYFASLVVVTINPKSKPARKTDSQLVQEAGAQLDAACQLDAEKC